MARRKPPPPRRRLVVDAAGALELLDRLQHAGPADADHLCNASVVMPDGSIAALGDHTGQQIATLREWVRSPPRWPPEGDS